jgi:hypothetical protein
LQYEAQLKDRLAELDDLSKAWAQALAMAPRILPNSHEQFAAAGEKATEIATNVLTLPTDNVDEALERMDHAMETLAGRLAKLRRVVYHDMTDSAPLPKAEFPHVGIVEDDEFTVREEEEDVDVDVDEELMIDILVADMVHETNEEKVFNEEEDIA